VISVCLAAFNGRRHIEAQVASILASPRVTELLVSDDGSTDGTQEVIAALADPRVRLLRGPGRGVVANFEHLLRQASGRYLFLADQDDVWLEGKVDAMLAALEHADLAVSDCSIVDDDLRVITPSFFAARGSGPGVLKNFLRNSFLGCCMAFRREVLDYVLPFPRGVAMHDWWIGLMVNRRGRVRFIDDILVQYRRHGANATDALVSQAPLLRQLRWRLALLGALLSRLPAS
jgi:glycosyltransferase involved in cell wall biosynthesis